MEKKYTTHFPVLFLKKKKNNWKTFKISEALLVKISHFKIRPVSGLGGEVLQFTPASSHSHFKRLFISKLSMEYHLLHERGRGASLDDMAKEHVGSK